MTNLVTAYIDFKKQKIKKYSLYLLEPIKIEELSDFENYVIEVFSRIYIQSMYFQVFETISEKNQENLKKESILEKELAGKRLELLYDIENNESIALKEKRNRRKIVDNCYKIIKLAIQMEEASWQEKEEKEISPTLIDICSKEIPLLYSQIEQLKKQIIKNQNKEEKFFEYFENLDFKICYATYRNHENIKKVNMKYQISKLSKNYKKQVIENVYHSPVLEKERILTTITLLNIDVLRKIAKNNSLNQYLIEIPEIFFQNKKNWTELLATIENPLLKKHLVFLLPYKVYTRHKAYLKNYIGKFQFATIVDFSHINDVKTKLDRLSELPLFQYIITTGVKSKDYATVFHYESDRKEWIMDELLQEEGGEQ